MYIPDFKNGKFLNYLEMESYLSGKKEAKYNYKPTKYLCSGVAFGLILGLLDTYQKDRGLLSKKNTTLLIATPLLSTHSFPGKKLLLVVLLEFSAHAKIIVNKLNNTIFLSNDNNIIF